MAGWERELFGLLLIDGGGMEWEVGDEFVAGRQTYNQLPRNTKDWKSFDGAGSTNKSTPTPFHSAIHSFIAPFLFVFVDCKGSETIPATNQAAHEINCSIHYHFIPQLIFIGLVGWLSFIREMKRIL